MRLLKLMVLAMLCLAAGSSGLSIMPSLLSVPAAAVAAEIGMIASAVLVIGSIVLRKWK